MIKEELLALPDEDLLDELLKISPALDIRVKKENEAYVLMLTDLRQEAEIARSEILRRMKAGKTL